MASGRDEARGTFALPAFDELHVGYRDRTCLTDEAGERLSLSGEEWYVPSYRGVGWTCCRGARAGWNSFVRRRGRDACAGGTCAHEGLGELDVEVRALECQVCHNEDHD